MKWIIVTIVIAGMALFCTSCRKKMDKTGCMDSTAINFDSTANVSCINCCYYTPKMGSLIFWTDDFRVISSCGELTIKLSNGMQSKIISYFSSSPPDCFNRFGGYFYVEEGTYTYQVVSDNGCVFPGGTIRVVGDGCNFEKVVRL